MPDAGFLTALDTVTPFWEVVIRLAAASLAGMAIGIEREVRRKPAGLRTHMLVSLGSAAFTVLTFEFYLQSLAAAEQVAAQAPDPLRVVQGVVAGVAFLAAGAIIQSRGAVRGLTTGVGIWIAGAIGMACGAGLYPIAVVIVAFALIILSALGYVERRLLGTRRRRLDSGDEEGPD